MSQLLQGFGRRRGVAGLGLRLQSDQIGASPWSERFGHTVLQCIYLSDQEKAVSPAMPSRQVRVLARERS